MFKHGAVHLHQINGFDHLTLGADMADPFQLGPARIYIERSYLMGGTVCVPQGADRSILPWMADVGLAPKELIEIPHACIFTGLQKEPSILRDLQLRFRRGDRPQFFRPTKLEADFVEACGLQWKQTLSCEPKLADRVADKAFLRRCAAEIGMEQEFPPHVILGKYWTPDEVYRTATEVLRRAEKIGMSDVILKRTDLASGDGFCRWSSRKRDAFLEAEQGHELIVEAAIDPHMPISNQWMIQEAGITYVGSSSQIQEGFVHKGNVVASDDAVIPDFVARKLSHITKPLAEHIRMIGYNGVLGFDAVWHEASHRLWLTECNARVTASTYAYGLGAQLHFRPWVVACKIIRPAEWLASFVQTYEALGVRLYKPQREHGIVPYMLSGLRLPANQRRLGLMAVANYPKTAELLLAEAERCLV